MEDQEFQPYEEVQEVEELIQEEIDNAFKDVTTQVHTFNSDDPPEVKAMKTMANGATTTTNPIATKEVISDIDEKTEKDILSSPISGIPGTIPTISPEEIPNIPEWVHIGWKQVANINVNDSNNISEKDYYNQILGELYFGKLWLNAGVVFVSIFATWLVTILGGGLGWVIIICAFVASYFKISVNRFYLNARSDISRELAIEKLETDTGEESVEWMNEFLRRFWLIYEPILSASIVQTADGILVASTPGFLDSIRLTTFTLGTKPVVIESIRSYPKSEDDIVVMDWKLSFNPNDLANMTKVQMARKVNPKIVLTIRVGRGMMGAGIPILLEDMSFSGLMRIKLKLINTFPHIKTVDISFLEDPKFDYALKPIGGETFGFDIANIPGLHSFIRDQVHANLRPMMYSPNEYVLDVEALMGGYPIEIAKGILKIKIYGAKELRNTERQAPLLFDSKACGQITFDAIWCPVVEPTETEPNPESNIGILRFAIHQARDLDPRLSIVGQYNPYAQIYLNEKPEPVYTTKVIKRNNSPIWEEAVELFVTHKQNAFISIKIFDSRDLAADPVVGSWSGKLSEFMSELASRNDWFTLKNASSGKLRLSCIWKPILNIENFDFDPIGIVKLHIKRGEIKNNQIARKADCYVIVRVDGDYRGRTDVIQDSNNPEWQDEILYIPVHSERELIELIVWDYEVTSKNKKVGISEISLNKLITKNEDGTITSKGIIEETSPLSLENSQRGSLTYAASFHPTLISEKATKEDENTTINESEYQSGVLVVHLKEAKMEKRETSVEIIVDNGLFPSAISEKCKTQNPKWDKIMEIFVKELDWSKITFNIKQFNDKNPIGVVTEKVLNLIELCKESNKEGGNNKGITLPISGINNATINLSVRFLPMNYKLDSSETIENMGILHVKVQNAENLIGVDRSGTSDPFFQFLKNDEKIFKTKVIKKNLNPVYDELFETNVFSRIRDSFVIEAYDWNQLGSAKKIGQGKRISSGTFMTATKTLTGVISGGGDAVVKGGTFAVGNGANIIGSGVNFVGSGAGNVVSEVGGIFKMNDNTTRSIKLQEVMDSPTEVSSPAAFTNTSKSASTETSSHFIENIANEKIDHLSKSAPTGNLILTLIEAKELVAADSGGTSDPFVKAKINKKEIYKTQIKKKTLTPTWNESVTIGDLTLDATSSILLQVRDYNLMGKDDDIGEYELKLWDYIKISNNNKVGDKIVEDIWVNLQKVPNGKLHVKLEFTLKK
ncbi:1017_t:CDS:10 [Diversispora eburnea]|uniref:1017_t:CDS:1 n=1 Tax=Diversispora eburnea TaxID=1213867 RepID=A0A9N9FML1_9GLOM|nr:1017_t:CDS:10 [Diversispora eburnea]